jgi:hypothetical protein
MPLMRTRLALATILTAALVAACSGSGGTTTTPRPVATNAQASSGQPADTAAPAGNVDCAAIKTASQQLLAIQLLAQLKSADTIESIRSKQFGNLDLDAFLAAMAALHALDGYTSPLGDPKAAIQVYEQAGQAAQVLFATDPITQEAIDTYNTNVGTVSEFLGHQIAIGGALDAAGC